MADDDAGVGEHDVGRRRRLSGYEGARRVRRLQARLRMARGQGVRLLRDNDLAGGASQITNHAELAVLIAELLLISTAEEHVAALEEHLAEGHWRCEIGRAHV